MGTVFDASTALPVAAAVVTASLQLIGKQVVTSDATGTFWLPQVPPGVYTVSVAAEKFQDRLCLDIALNADQTPRIKVNLIPEGVAVMGIIVPCPD